MISIAWVLIPALLLFCLYQIISLGLPRFFLVPSHNWQDKIRQTINHKTPIYLKVGAKRSSYRRRLITASVQPSYYTNFVNNKLKLQPVDAANKDETFMKQMKARAPNDPTRRVICGFFHPYANNGGGGEKVLWQAILATLQENQRNIVAVYTTNIEAEPKKILEKAKTKFKVTQLDVNRIVFIYLRKFASLIDGDYWKHFTLAGQLIGSVLLALEAMYELSPDKWIDTMGVPGSYWPVSLILKIPIVAYVHYPIIQPDMFSKLKFKTLSDAKHLTLTTCDAKQLLKFGYWSLLYYVYKYLGSCVDITLANGTWTLDHITNIWTMNQKKIITILYPPCSTEDMALEESKALSAPRLNKMLYIAQFRPEKRHSLVLSNYKAFVEKFRASKGPLSNLPTLVFLGSCRTPTDSSTLDRLREQVADFGLLEYVEFIVDCSFDEVKETLRTCKFGLNAMWNEHFGIGVVEYLSAGVVPIVHASAGPLLDIVRKDKFATTWKNEVGFFFKSESDPDYKRSSRDHKKDDMLEFEIRGEQCAFPTLANLLSTLFIHHTDEVAEDVLQKKRELGARLLLERFSNFHFVDAWNGHLRAVCQLEEQYRETRRDKVDRVH